MIDIIQTEQNIEDILNSIDTPKGFKIRRFPGSMDDLGKPINCLQVIITFDDLSFDDVPNIHLKKCVALNNVAKWKLRIYSISPRDYHAIAELGTDIVSGIRGKTILATDDGQNTGISHTIVDSYGFVKAEKGYCYRFDIDLRAHFAESYQVQS